MTNHYAILGLGMGASPEAIKSAYRKRVRSVHPDAGHKEAQDFFAVQIAYQVLSDASLRALHDSELVAWLRSTGQLLCAGCGVANRVPRIPTGFRPTCGGCGAALPMDETQRRTAVRTALLVQAAGFAEEVGGEILSVAKDAAVEGIDRLRGKLGIRKYGGRR